MGKDDEFVGRPWNAEPTLDWNRVGFWADYYRDLIAHPDRRESVVRRRLSGLLRILPELGWLPRPPETPAPTVLDAGCGIALIPHVLAYWGLLVTAIDLCPEAIRLAGQMGQDEAELSKCMEMLEPAHDLGFGYYLVDDPDRLRAKLREYRADGGSVEYLLADWHATHLRPETFDLIHCRNSLRLAPKRYWRQSLQRFHELLAPGGVLYLECVNAIGIQDEVEALAREVGFWLPRGDNPIRDPSGGKTLVGWWPTG